MRPNDGKHIAKGKGVHREVESEGSRRQKVWPDGQKSHIRPTCRVRLQWKSKPDSHSEYMWVNAAGIRLKEHVLIWGGLADEPFGK